MSEISTGVSICYKQLSVEIPNSGGARKSKILVTGDKTLPYENLKTTWDAVRMGSNISENKPCFGWRSSISGYSWITYNEFIKRVENFGSGLIKIGMQPGQLSNVGIYAKNSVEWIIAQFGIWSQSAVLIPLYHNLGAETSIFMINNAEIVVAICDEEEKVRHLIARKNETPTLKHFITTNTVNMELQNFAYQNGVKIYSFIEVEEIGEKHLATFLYPKASDIALICYTSGATGDPKGVVLTHENVMSVSTSVHILMGDSTITKEDLLISYLPMAHIFGQIVQLIMLMAGARTGFYSGDVSQLTHDMKQLQPTVFPAVPKILNNLHYKAQGLAVTKLNIDLNADIPEMGSELKSTLKPIIDSLGGKVRLIFSGAAPIFKSVAEFYTKYVGCKVIEGYGQTECSGPCTYVIHDSTSNSSVGSPIPFCTVKLVDAPELGYFAKDSKGEVCVRGPGVFKCYLKDPKKTLEVLDNDGWLHTGDIGLWLPNGTLQIIDRKKNILKFAQGLYVAIEKIEIIYAQSLFVSQIFIHGDSLKSVLVAVVVPEKETVLQWCEKNLKKCDSWDDICKDPSIRQLILEDLLRTGKEAGLHAFEQVKAIHLHTEVLTSEAGFFTPTTKLKREVWKTYFAKIITVLINGI